MLGKVYMYCLLPWGSSVLGTCAHEIVMMCGYMYLCIGIYTMCPRSVSPQDQTAGCMCNSDYAVSLNARASNAYPYPNLICYMKIESAVNAPTSAKKDVEVEDTAAAVPSWS